MSEDEKTRFRDVDASIFRRRTRGRGVGQPHLDNSPNMSKKEGTRFVEVARPNYRPRTREGDVPQTRTANAHEKATHGDGDQGTDEKTDNLHERREPATNEDKGDGTRVNLDNSTNTSDDGKMRFKEVDMSVFSWRKRERGVGTTRTAHGHAEGTRVDTNQTNDLVERRGPVTKGCMKEGKENNFDRGTEGGSDETPDQPESAAQVNKQQSLDIDVEQESDDESDKSLQQLAPATKGDEEPSLRSICSSPWVCFFVIALAAFCLFFLYGQSPAKDKLSGHLGFSEIGNITSYTPTNFEFWSPTTCPDDNPNCLVPQELSKVRHMDTIEQFLNLNRTLQELVPEHWKMVSELFKAAQGNYSLVQNRVAHTESAFTTAFQNMEGAGHEGQGLLKHFAKQGYMKMGGVINDFNGDQDIVSSTQTKIHEYIFVWEDEFLENDLPHIELLLFLTYGQADEACRKLRKTWVCRMSKAEWIRNRRIMPGDR